MANKVPARRVALLALPLSALGAALLFAVPFSPERITGQASAEAAEIIPAPPPASEVDAPVLMPIHRWLRPREFAWNDETAPPGPVRVVVDLRARTLSVYRSGVEIGRSFITYGTDEKPTPIGRFRILEKDADHVSNLYDSPMPYMLRLTNDGIAIHGGEIEDDVATRGCVGLPTEFAKLLFAQAKLGGEVLIVRGPPEGGRYTAYAALPL